MNDGNKSGLLEELIYQTIPLGKAMKLKVTQLTNNTICIEAPVSDANANIHNTAFAGSIYSLCALSAWGFVHARLLVENISAEVVLAQAEIRYLLPITENIKVSCSIDEQAFIAFQNRLLEKGRARINMTAIVQENDEIQATLEASVSAKITTG